MILKLKEKPKPRVSWTEDTVDNEGMNKKKSNRKCIIIQYVAFTIDLERKVVILAQAMMRVMLSKEIDTQNICIKRNAPSIERNNSRTTNHLQRKSSDYVNLLNNKEKFISFILKILKLS